MMGDEEQLDIEKIGEGEEAPEGEGEGEKKRFLSDKLIRILWFVLGGILLVIIVVTAAYITTQQVMKTQGIEEKESEMIEKPGDPLSVQILEEFRVNLTGEQKHFIRVIIALGYPKEEVKLGSEISARMSEIRHIIFLSLSGKRIDELDSREEKERFLEEIKIEINKSLRSPVKIKRIFIHDMVLM